MKDSLVGFIKEIITSIGVDVNEYKVFSQQDILPEPLLGVSFVTENIVCVWIDSHKLPSAKEKFESFLRKQVYSTKNIIYWHEGLDLKSKPQKNPEVAAKTLTVSKKHEIDRLKCSTILPTWLEQSIFKKHHAQYAPNHERFDMNLDLSDEELKVYLGTYFPRSYCESFCIFENIFENQKYRSLATKETINILDIGSGSGGNLFGLLVAINKYAISKQEVNIISIDGHAGALEILSELMEDFTKISNFNIKLKTVNKQLKSITDMHWLENNNFDLIISSKLGCELIANGWTDFYAELTDFCLPKLSSTGLYVLLDVTTKVTSDYNPILMSNQINSVIKNMKHYKSLIPISCGEFESTCTGNCFTQRIFYIAHKFKRKDKSKVAYRIIGQTDFVNQLAIYKNGFQYINIFEEENSIVRCCQNSVGEDKTDNYKLKI